MIIDAKFVLFMIVPYLAATSFPQGANQSFSLSIAAQEETAKTGSEIKIKTTLTNVTKHDLTFFDTNRDCDYPVEVRNDNGNPAPETEYKQQLRCKEGPSDGRIIMVNLKPQEARHDEIVVTRLYDLTRPGKYFVQVLRKVPKELGQGTVKSNILTITVTE
jgi:hypothetical protein